MIMRLSGGTIINLMRFMKSVRELRDSQFHLEDFRWEISVLQGFSCSDRSPWVCAGIQSQLPAVIAML
jgi:hypothetical protein